MERKIIETCFNCNVHQIRFKKIKKINFCTLYLCVCRDCPYKSEFMILSGNENTELPISKSNVDDIIDLMKKNNAYHVEITSKYINMFFDKSFRRTFVEKSKCVFDFLKFLDWSDNIKQYAEKLKIDFSKEFLKNLIDKRTSI